MPTQAAPYFSGFNFPFAFDSATGGVASAQLTDTNDALIQQSIVTILLTSVNETVGNRPFGSTLRASLFEPSNSTLFPLIQYNVITALAQLESRIQVVTVQVTQVTDPNTQLPYISVFIGYLNLVTQKPSSLTVQY